MNSPSGPTLGQLRAFRAVAEFLHFGRAARELGMSQSALSAALASCEDALGGRLVERTTRRVMLTALGADLLPSAERALTAIDELVLRSGENRAPFTGRLRLGLIPTIAPYLLPRTLAMLQKAHPDLEPTVQEDRTAPLLEALGAGKLDLLVLATPSPGLVELPLYDEDFVLAVPADHPLAGREGLEPAVLREVDVLLLTGGHCLREQAVDLCRAAGADPQAVSRAGSLTTLVQLVAAGMGVTVLPETALELESRRSRLGTARFARPAPGRRITLVHRPGDPHAAEYAVLAEEVRRMARVRRLPVQLVDVEV